MDWKTYEQKFEEKSLPIFAWYEQELAKLRTGKVTAVVLDHIKVEAYGELQRINQIANISSPEPRVLIIKAYDSSLYKNIANAISNSGLNINPQIDADKIRLVFPALTEESRKEMTKKAKSIAEDAKIRVRRLRQEIHDNFKKDEELTDDDKKNYINNLDKTTKLKNEKIEKILELKNKEILTI